MKFPALCVWPFALFVSARTAFAAPPLAPPAEEWPQVEPAVVVADGFHQAGWDEFQWRDNAWEPTRRKELRYDGEARLASIHHESWFNDAWRTSRLETMTHDGSGRLVEKVSQEAIGVTLQNRGRSTYEYSVPFTILESVAAWSHEQKWLPLSQEIFRFDEEGRLVEHTSNRLQGNLVRGASKILHRHDDAGRRTEALKQRDQGGKWIDAERVVFTYDAHGRLDRAAMFVAGKPGAKWTEALRITHEYDDAGRCTVTQRHTPVSTSALEVSSQVRHFYDEHGNEVERRFQARRDNAWFDARKEAFGHRPQP